MTAQGERKLLIGDLLEEDGAGKVCSLLQPETFVYPSISFLRCQKMDPEVFVVIS